MDKENSINQTNIIDIKEIDTCCSSTPFFFTKYIILVCVSLIILTFCIIQIILHNTEPNTIYFSLIAHILGIFINPNSTTKK